MRTRATETKWHPVMRRAIGLAGWGLCASAVLGFLVLLPAPVAQPGLLLACAVLTVGLGVSVLHAAKCWAAAALLLVWVSWAVVIAAMTVTDGLYSPLVLALPGLLSICVWIYGPRATLAMLALTLCTVLVLLLAPMYWPQLPLYLSPYLVSYTVPPAHATPQYVMLHVSSILLMTSGGMLLVRRGVIAQSTRMRRAQADLQQQQEELRTFHSAVEQNPHSIVMTDAQQRIVYVNQAFVRRSGFSRQAVLGQSTQRYSTMGMPPIVRHAAYRCLALGRPWRGKLVNKTRAGQELTEAVLIAPVRGESGSITHYVEIKQDLSGHVRAEQQIHDLVHFNALTGLPNRLTLSLRLRALAGASKGADAQHGLLLLNMDRFTAFNDAQGMLRGDDLLRAIAQRLTDSIPARGSLLAHVGVDEFAVLLENVGADAAPRLHQAARALQQALLRPLSLDDFASATAPANVQPPASTTQMTCCIGGCLFAATDDGAAPDALRQANLALRQAKLLGPGHVLMHTPAMSHAADKRFRTDRELRQAISAGHLRLYLQTQVNAQGRCVGAETLVRWKHPTLGLVPPQDFIPVAEESDAIVLLGDWVLDTACRMLASRQFTDQPWRLSVNVSGHQFCQNDFVEKLQHVLRQTGAAPQRLTLEITESVAMRDMHEAQRRMLQLRALGVELALDDFGTGYSSLSCLKELPFQELKIDQSFVRDCTASESAASMVEAILLLAARLGLRVVAEGVENAQQAQTLRAWHPKIVFQGYYYGKPQPARDWLKQQTPPTSPAAMTAAT